MKRSGPLERKTELRRGDPPARKTRLRGMSDRRRKELAVLARAQEEARARSGGRCEAVLLDHRCPGVASEFHHVQPRMRTNHTAANLLHVCSTAHRTITDNPTLARSLGYARSRYSNLR